MPRFPFLLVLALSLASTAFAADDPLAFGKSPAKWLMTDQEAQTWRKMKTVDDAQMFIDLFWARRDPTPGTYANEFRAEYESRVAYADKHFKERRTRGSLTERGRVLTVLGFPSNIGQEVAKVQAQQASGGSGDPTGGRRLAGRDVWLWNHADAQKFDMPKVEVVFLIDPMMGTSHRDPQRPDFVTAMPVAIRKSLVNPELMEVPDWARPQVLTTPSTVTLRVERESGTTTQTVTRTTTIIPAALPTAKPKGAGKLTLLRDAFAIDAQTKSDPFAGVPSLEAFKSGEELSFVAEYCAGVIAEELSGVTIQPKITGMINGEKINMSGAAEELIPDSIKASPGCHLIRGAVPLEGVDPGQYTLTLAVTAGAEKYNLTREFRVE